jgi:hypothetical protein
MESPKDGKSERWKFESPKVGKTGKIINLYVNMNLSVKGMI